MKAVERSLVVAALFVCIGCDLAEQAIFSSFGPAKYISMADPERRCCQNQRQRSVTVQRLAAGVK